MAKLIQDLWIFTQDGIVLYHRAFDPKVNEQLFGGLMSALNSFAENLVEGGLSSFEMEHRRFTLLKREGYIFIANSSRKVKEKYVLVELNYVADKFFSIYQPEFLKEWKGDTSVFANFEVEIKDSLKEVISKLVKAFW